MSELLWVPGRVPEWQWVQRLEQYLEEDEFLQQNRAGAVVGGVVGGVAVGAAAVAGVVSVATATVTATASAAAAAEAAGAATVAAGGASAVAYQVGHKVGHAAGKATAQAVLKNTAYAALASEGPLERTPERASSRVLAGSEPRSGNSRLPLA